MVVTRIVENLMETGLSEYEARAYVGLLASHPATAYEVAKGSRIPTSKIYEVMSKLEKKGVVSVMGGEKTKKYIPIEPREFVASRRRMMRSVLEELEGGLGGAGMDEGSSYIWNIKDYGFLMDKASRLIEGAKTSVLASLFSEEMKGLGPLLEEAQGRGVRVAAIHFGMPESRLGFLYQHPIHDTIYAEKGGRGLIVVRDTCEALIGTVARDGASEGAYSTNRGWVTLAEDYIRHDIYVMKMVRRFGGQMTEAFGPRYEKLRDVFSGPDDL